MTESEGVVHAPEGQLAVGLYSYARVVGDLIFVAGHTALGPDGAVLHPGDPLAQMRHTLDAINETLATYGATLNDMVQIRWYLTDVRYREAILAIRHEYFVPPYPTSTLLGVSALALEGLTVEVDGVAVRRDRG
jgi:enamine deaminase RidA (YjgF/YER057c/UK114 family)